MPPLYLKDLLFVRSFRSSFSVISQPFVQKGQLPKPLRQHVEAEFERFENLAVRLEA